MSIIPSASPNDTTTALSPEHEAEIRTDLAAIPAPPWRWVGSRHAGGPELVTDHSGRQYLLRATKPADHQGDELLDPETDAVVYGDLEFRDQREGETYSSMRSGNSLAIGRTEYDPDAIVGVANPIAHWVEKSAQHATELLAEVDRLRAEVSSLSDDVTGTCLTRWEEEQDNARLRLALASAQRGRRELRARLEAFEALELGTPEGRISAKCEDATHPVWLRELSDVRGCPWCRVAQLERSAALAEEDYRRVVRGASQVEAGLRARVAELETRSPWERAVAGLNALVDADIAFWIEPDGHISGPFGDEHIEWDQDAARWRLVHDDEDEVHPPHPAPCRVPSSPDCTCASTDVPPAARRPRQFTPMQVLAHDVETAIEPLTGDARDGAEIVLRYIRTLAAPAAIPFTTEATS